jgi:hypothetical protein
MWSARPTGAVFERRASVWSPGKLEDGIRSLHALDPQACPQPTGAEILHELVDGAANASPILGGESLPVAVEPGGALPGGHLLERLQE